MGHLGHGSLWVTHSLLCRADCGYKLRSYFRPFVDKSLWNVGRMYVKTRLCSLSTLYLTGLLTGVAAISKERTASRSSRLQSKNSPIFFDLSLSSFALTLETINCLHWYNVLLQLVPTVDNPLKKELMSANFWLSVMLNQLQWMTTSSSISAQFKIGQEWYRWHIIRHFKDFYQIGTVPSLFECMSRVPAFQGVPHMRDSVIRESAW